jgi:heptosyltransferase-3
MGVSPRGAYKVGLHPFASLACKLWPQANWVRLARELLDRGYELTAFSAPNEREALQGIFAELDGSLTLFTGNLAEFAHKMSSLDALIGLDSFSVHMAHRQGIPSIKINAGTPPELWAVPSGQTLGASGGCRHYPCYNLAPCTGTPYENACVEAVSPAQVLAVVESLRLAPAQGSGLE